MKTAAVIAELNPLHSGHARLFAKARENCDALMVVMSPDFVQRGTPAVFDKYVRAEMALRAGADLVLELPVAAAASSAAHFAEGGCALLEALGVADELWFGSEEGSVEPFLEAAEYLAEEPEPFGEVLAEALKAGDSYPAAREKALCACVEAAGKRLPDGFLSGPNNILGLEYVRALQKRNSRIVPKTIGRNDGGYHDLSMKEEYVSASAIRQSIEQMPADEAGAEDRLLTALAGKVPGEALRVYRNAVRNGWMHEDAFSEMLHYRLLCETKESLCEYADVPEDLANRILRLLPAYQTFSSFADLVKSRNSTRTQINRALLHILLDIRPEHVEAAKEPKYAHLLGIRDRAADALLPAIKEHSRISLLNGIDAVSVARRLKLPDAAASRLYESVRARRAGQEPVPEESRKFLHIS